jgi:hypothetical protein
MDFLPWSTFARYGTRYGGDKNVRSLTGRFRPQRSLGAFLQTCRWQDAPTGKQPLAQRISDF